MYAYLYQLNPVTLTLKSLIGFKILKTKVERVAHVNVSLVMLPGSNLGSV